jgi:hypothetical protein
MESKEPLVVDMNVPMRTRLALVRCGAHDLSQVCKPTEFEIKCKLPGTAEERDQAYAELQLEITRLSSGS